MFTGNLSYENIILSMDSIFDSSYSNNNNNIRKS